MASTTSQTPYSYASDSIPTSWDVYLSFRDLDTRYTFTGHLYTKLHRVGIRTFMDNRDLHSGEVIAETLIPEILIQVIRESKIYIVVFSEGYASSSWRLDNLVEILNCNKRMHRLVIPVFYNIDPSVVRHQTGSFEEAFLKHEALSDKEKVNKWRLTLNEVADFSGYHISKHGSAADIISEIVDVILLRIYPKALDVAKCPVGLDSSLKGITESWDVFLSFRGEDTRLNFTSHLYAALDCYKIRTYEDDPALRSGGVISNALLQAIQESKTYVVVLSENYASSSWCLDELVEILNCHKTMQRLVIPVFYKIDASVVQHQIGSFKDAFQRHQIRFGHEMKKVEKWRLALTQIAGFQGKHVSERRYDADIINEIVDEIVLEINPKTLDVTKYPVGLDSRVKDITSLLSSYTEGMQGMGGVDKITLAKKISMYGMGGVGKTALAKKIGIYGMGGVGKTTLAKAVYNQNYNHFQGSCFLANVREVSRKKGLEYLQQQLINDVLNCPNINIDNVDQGIELIRARICSVKVLIVIDDLDDPRQLEFLEGPYALGSRIIITTRNEDLLDSIKVEARYKVNELGDAESRQLFSQHAFGDNKISDTFTELSQEILQRAGGLPLALKVFGSNLLNQSEELKQLSIGDVEKKLLISFNSLKSIDPRLQDMFLDIACFFIGWKKEEVVKIMETCYMFVNHSIGLLKKRCLLTINDRDELEMHDLLRDMGREIACNNFTDEPGKRSRLWVLPEPGKKRKLKELDARGATKLEKLPIKASQIAVSLKKLDLSRSALTALPSSISQFSNLVSLDIRYCCDLLSIAVLPPSLKRITAYGCTSIERLNLSNLKRLEILDLTDCSGLREIEGLDELTSIRVLNLTDCNSSLLAYTFTEHFFQIYSGFGHQIKIYVLSTEFPDWMSHLRKSWSTVSLDLQPNVSQKFLGMILCLVYREDEEFCRLDYSIKTNTGDFRWSDDGLYTPFCHESRMVIVPRSIFSIRDGDDRIELTVNAEIHGIHLLYKMLGYPFSSV